MALGEVFPGPLIFPACIMPTITICAFTLEKKAQFVTALGIIQHLHVGNISGGVQNLPYYKRAARRIKTTGGLFVITSFVSGSSKRCLELAEGFPDFGGKISPPPVLGRRPREADGRRSGQGDFALLPQFLYTYRDHRPHQPV